MEEEEGDKEVQKQYGEEISMKRKCERVCVNEGWVKSGRSKRKDKKR